MPTTTRLTCPVCDNNTLERIDIPKFELFRCPSCGEVTQRLQSGQLAPLSMLLQRHELGDDRVRAATSTPTVTTVASFLEIYEGSQRIIDLSMAEARGGLRTTLAQIENRIEYALSVFSALGFVSDNAGNALAALREARELVSTKPGRNRGIPSTSIQGPKDGGDESA